MATRLPSRDDLNAWLSTSGLKADGDTRLGRQGRALEDLLAEIDADPTFVFWG